MVEDTETGDRGGFIHGRDWLLFVLAAFTALGRFIKRQARLIKIINLREARFDGFVSLRIERYSGVRHIIEQAEKFGIEKAEPMFDAGKFAGGGDGFVQRIAIGHCAE